MRDVVIFGIGQIAEVMHYYLTQEGGRRVVGFTVDREYLSAEQSLGLPVVPFEDVADAFSPSTHDMFIAISSRRVNRARQAKVVEAEAKGYALASHISPHAVVWSGFKLEPNTFIMENNVVQPYAQIGRNVIVWSGNHIGHHSRIGDHCFIASHVVISGSVSIGEGTFIGVNATIRDNVSIGTHNVIGAGALISSNTPNDAVYMAEPTELSKVPSHRLRSI